MSCHLSQVNSKAGFSKAAGGPLWSCSLTGAELDTDTPVVYYLSGLLPRTSSGMYSSSVWRPGLRGLVSGCGRWWWDLAEKKLE